MPLLFSLKTPATNAVSKYLHEINIYCLKRHRQHIKCNGFEYNASIPLWNTHLAYNERNTVRRALAWMHLHVLDGDFLKAFFTFFLLLIKLPVWLRGMYWTIYTTSEEACTTVLIKKFRLFLFLQWKSMGYNTTVELIDFKWIYKNKHQYNFSKYLLLFSTE